MSIVGNDGVESGSQTLQRQQEQLKDGDEALATTNAAVKTTTGVMRLICHGDVIQLRHDSKRHKHHKSHCSPQHRETRITSKASERQAAV